ncbi:MAG: alpha-galactosidase [Acidobacteria bacterium]|nr:alpha-galactosidase [Acidobacteriota bacterium]
MDRRQFMARSLTGLSVVCAQGSDRGMHGRELGGFASLDDSAQLSALPSDKNLNSVRSDWLVAPFPQKTGIYRTSRKDEIAMTNGLIRRSWRLRPNAATVSFDNLMTGASILRGIKPEAYVELNWQELAVGGLKGQPDYAYFTPEWLDQMTADPRALRCTGFKIGKTEARFAWKRTRFSGNQPWPPPGSALTFRYEPGDKELAGINVFVHYEMYDGIPLLSKWLTIHNGSSSRVRLNRFTNEVLAAVEYESVVSSGRWHNPNLHVESDYEFVAIMNSDPWVPDPDYTTQVDYNLETPCLLQVHPPLGPDVDILPGKTFESYRTYELVYDSTDRERKGLGLRRMYRTIAPWVTENPIFMHVTSEKPEAVKAAIDQAAEVGFEMVIISFGTGFDPENQDPKFIREMKSLADYGKQKGVVLGGYSLLASRNISPEDDVINPKTGTTKGAIFGYSPCLGSRWGIAYFKKLRFFFEKTGMGALENDGSYPGDVCASIHHPGHRGLEDSQWTQWKEITSFYQWCRARGIYLNVPDWYFLNGSNKTAMGYRETDWSLPRAQQVIIGRQNIFDGTWEKAPGMGWMFVPLVQYHGGGAAATIEPLREHLETYGQILAQNLGSGVQAAYRGYQLYDTDQTRAVVKKWVDFYKAHRAILESDIIHVRRADGRDLDAVLHVNPQLAEKGFVMVYNPLDVQVTRTLTLPLYYTGLTHTATIREREGKKREYHLNRRAEVEVSLSLPAHGLTWLVVE